MFNVWTNIHCWQVAWHVGGLTLACGWQFPDFDRAVAGTRGEVETVWRPGAGPDDARVRLHHPTQKPER